MALTITTLASTPSTSSPAELAHYKDLFSKLRFSYTEQVTKERLLKSLVADPPDLDPLSPSALSSAEASLADDKAALKAKKDAVQALLLDLDRQSRAVAREATEVEELERAVEMLPGELEGLREQVEGLRPQGEEEENPLCRMGLGRTREEVQSRREAMDRGNEEARALSEALEARRRDVARLRGEVEGLEGRKRGLVDEVRALKKRGAEGDEIDRQGRWVRAQLGVLEGLVG